jgi:hypothetical protein
MPVAGRKRVLHIDLRIKYFVAAGSRMANSSSSSSSVPSRMRWVEQIVISNILFFMLKRN